MLKGIKKFLKRLLKSLKIKLINDIPINYNEDTIYIVGSKFKWIIVFLCPCGCSDIIYLNLLKEEFPNWSYTFTKQKLTINPSIRRTKGCKSHFWIRKNKVIWCV